ncbi:MAG: Asp23/Gls24 family envelope stress response protein [Clostridia bacterium]|nr:Asp23/Gls24 family envelope stress response protein [Clostridia bacterium]
MAPKKENLPLTTNPDGEPTGTITYASEVIAVIAGVAANEVEGVAGMCTASTGISDVFSRNKNITKGVKVEVGTEEVSVDLYLNVEYGTPIQTAATNVQESVRKSIETMTGLHVVRVDVHVQGLSFEKEKKENLVGLENFEGQAVEKTETAPEKEEETPAAQEEVKPEPVVSFVEEVAAEAEEVVSEETEATETAQEEPVQEELQETEQENQTEE